MSAQAQNADISKDVETDEVVVTGTRNSTDIRHLPMTITTVNHLKLTESHRTSVLPTLTEQVPSLFVTSRGVMGYGVSGGAAGGISLRGISGGSGQLMVLIDGHPQYMGIFGHPIADVYQSLMSEKVEVLRGPASVLYGSNAMGGVINIVTRKMLEDGEWEKILELPCVAKYKDVKLTSEQKAKGKINLYSYLYNNQDALDYPEYRSKGFFCGSGAVESGHRTVMQKRIKQAGMQWKPSKAQGVLTLRAKLLSNLWDFDVVPLVRNRYRYAYRGL